MHLFSDIKFHDYKRQRVDEMEDEISELSSDELENSTDALALIFAEKYGHSRLRVHDPIKEDGGEVKKDVSDDPRRMVFDRSTPTYKTAQRITVKLPYEGPKQMLKVLPKSHTMSLPQADRVTDSYIIFNVDFFSEETDADEVQDKIDKRISDIESYVSRANGSIRTLNNHLETKARAAIDRRWEQVEAANDIMDEIGVDRDSETPTGYVKPEKKRDIDITTDADAGASHEVLLDDTFSDILGIIDEFGVSLERSAATVRDLNEESLRDLFLKSSTHTTAASPPVKSSTTTVRLTSTFATTMRTCLSANVNSGKDHKVSLIPSTSSSATSPSVTPTPRPSSSPDGTTSPPSKVRFERQPVTTTTMVPFSPPSAITMSTDSNSPPAHRSSLPSKLSTSPHSIYLVENHCVILPWLQ